MTIITSYDFESDTWTHHTESAVADDTMAEHQRWVDAVHQVAERAHQAMPTHAERIEKALTLVLEGHVAPQGQGVFYVRSQVKGSPRTYTVNGFCECPDARRAKDGCCKHLLATFLYRRAKRLVQEPTPEPTPEPTETPTETPTEASTQQEVDPMSTAGIPVGLRPFITHLHGKPFVRYAGLLALAHERGLVQLSTRIEFHDDNLVLASATATFQDGKAFTEWADAMPGNVGSVVRPHWIRMALTRAKARALRDALQIGIAALEELSDTE
jgi:hypothetical protein